MAIHRKWRHTYTNYDVTWRHTYINYDVNRMGMGVWHKSGNQPSVNLSWRSSFSSFWKIWRLELLSESLSIRRSIRLHSFDIFLSKSPILVHYTIALILLTINRITSSGFVSPLYIYVVSARDCTTGYLCLPCPLPIASSNKSLQGKDPLAFPLPVQKWNVWNLEISQVFFAN